jgi:metallo-beta-lactamase family protein
VLDSLSAHADREGLLAYAQGCGPDVRHFFLVHGEPDQQRPLRGVMEAQGMRVQVPRRGESIELTLGRNSGRSRAAKEAGRCA